jgi:tetrahydromethanopterin S-methyltransferase subunit D
VLTLLGTAQCVCKLASSAATGNVQSSNAMCIQGVTIDTDIYIYVCVCVCVCVYIYGCNHRSDLGRKDSLTRNDTRNQLKIRILNSHITIYTKSGQLAFFNMTIKENETVFLGFS